MNIAVFGKLIEMVKQIFELSKTVMDSSDPEKYANAVNDLEADINKTYEQMRQIIVNSSKFTEEEKLERLQALAEQEHASKEKCGAALKGNREHVAMIAIEVLKGFFTCGISFVPAIVKQMKGALSENKPIDIQDIDESMIIEEDTTADSENT